MPQYSMNEVNTTFKLEIDLDDPNEFIFADAKNRSTRWKPPQAQDG
jgi:hypothetical protein